MGRMRSAAYRWFEEHPWAGDALLGCAFGVGLAVDALLFGQELPAAPVLLVSALPLFLRRTRPELAFLAATLVMLLHLWSLPGPTAAVALAPLIVHSTVAHARPAGWGRAALVVGLIGSVLGPIRWGYVRVDDVTLGVMAFGVCASTVVAAFLLGEHQREVREHRAEQLRAVSEKAALVAAEREQRTTLLAATERARIARELHDIVAHSLSVVIVQADGALAVARTRPELAESVLRTIADTSRDALAEMRRLVGVLRSGPDEDADDGYAPAQGIADLAALVDQLRGSGVTVRLSVTGAACPIPAGLDLTVYRLVQEALTNVLRHAGPGATAQVRLCYAGQVLEVSVVDDGRGAAAAPSVDGHGLVGMRERVTLQGGTLRAGPVVGGGFSVAAEFPLPLGVGAGVSAG